MKPRKYRSLNKEVRNLEYSIFGRELERKQNKKSYDTNRIAGPKIQKSKGKTKRK